MISFGYVKWSSVTSSHQRLKYSMRCLFFYFLFVLYAEKKRIIRFIFVSTEKGQFLWCGGPGGNWTRDRRIFPSPTGLKSPLLCLAELRARSISFEERASLRNIELTVSVSLFVATVYWFCHWIYRQPLYSRFLRFSIPNARLIPFYCWFLRICGDCSTGFILQLLWFRRFLC